MSGAVYSGRRRLGHVVEHDIRNVEAFDASGVSLGRFPNRKAAVAAIPDLPRTSALPMMGGRL